MCSCISMELFMFPAFQLLSEAEKYGVSGSTGEHERQQYMMKLLIGKPANANTFRLFEEALEKRSRRNSRVREAWKLLHQGK